MEMYQNTKVQIIKAAEKGEEIEYLTKKYL